MYNVTLKYYFAECKNPKDEPKTTEPSLVNKNLYIFLVSQSYCKIQFFWIPFETVKS